MYFFYLYWHQIYVGHEFGRVLTDYGVKLLEKRIIADGGFRLKTEEGGGGLDPQHKFMLRLLEESEKTTEEASEEFQLIDGHHRLPLFQVKYVSDSLP